MIKSLYLGTILLADDPNMDNIQDSQKATNSEFKKIQMVYRDGGILRKIDFDPKDAQKNGFKNKSMGKVFIVKNQFVLKRRGI